MKNLKLYFSIIALSAIFSGGCQGNKLLLESGEENGSRIPPDTLISIASVGNARSMVYANRFR